MKTIALAAALATPTLVCADTDPVTGVWNVKGRVEGFSVRVRCEFERRGDELAGLCRDGGVPDGTAHEVSDGQVQGDHVTWTYHRRFLLHTYRPQFSGVLDGGSIKGAILVAGHSGEFTAERE